MKKIKLLILIGLGLLINNTYAQDTIAADTSWKKGGIVSLSFAQVSLNNWAGGGQSSVAVNGFLNLFANYQKGVHSWENNLDLGYGIIQQGSQDFRKSDDKIDFTSKYGRKASKNWYYTALLNFKSQFAPGYNYPDDSVKISDFLAPGYVLASLGMDYKPSDMFSLYVSPITGKFTIVTDSVLSNAGAFGVDPGEKLRSEFGGYVKIKFIKDIFENVNLQSKLELFSNYSNNPENIDVNWETILAMKVNKFLTANVSATLVYDDDIDIVVDRDAAGLATKVGPRTQFKEVLSIGLAYKF